LGTSSVSETNKLLPVLHAKGKEMAKAKEIATDQDLEVNPERPQAVLLEVRTPAGEVWGQIMAPAKDFKTGSTGFYANGKITNPNTGEKYQVGCNIILIGSKKK
jgi:hypothetical protein